jgi:hypothetical protein
VRDVRDDCYAGETIHGVMEARKRGLVWRIEILAAIFQGPIKEFL